MGEDRWAVGTEGVRLVPDPVSVETAVDGHQALGCPEVLVIEIEVNE